MERTVSFVYSFYLNGNYKYKVRLVCNGEGRTIFCNVWFSAIHNLEHLIYELESNIQDTYISGKEERVQILDLKNPQLQDFLSVSTIIEVVGQKVFANALSSFLAFLDNRRFEKEYLFQTDCDNVGFKVNKYDLVATTFSIEFNEHYDIEIDLWVLKFHSGAESFREAIQFYILLLKQIIKGEVKSERFFVRDEIVFETYFIVDSLYSQYFGFIDKENVEVPEFIAEISTANLLTFLNACYAMIDE